MADISLAAINEVLWRRAAYSSSRLDSCKESVASILNAPESDEHVKALSYIMYLCNDGRLTPNTSEYKEGQKVLCKELVTLLDSYNIQSSANVDGDVKSTLAGYLLSIGNMDLSVEDYKKDDYWTQDIINIYNIAVKVSKEVNGYNQDVLDDIKNGEVYIVKRNRDDVVGSIVENLKRIYENTFGLYPYLGCFTFSTGTVQYDGFNRTTSVWYQPLSDDASKTFTVQFGKDVDRDSEFTVLMEQLMSLNLPNFDVSDSSNKHVSYSFSVKYSDMFDKVVYYPSLCLSLLSGSTIDTNEFDPKESNMRVYKKTGAGSWQEYAGVVNAAIDEMFVKFSYKAMEYMSGVDFTSDKFRANDFRRRKEFYNNNLGFSSKTANGGTVQNEVTRLYRNFQQSLCSACILSRDDDGDLYRILISTVKDGKASRSVSSKDVFDIKAFTGNKAIDWNYQKVDPVAFPDTGMVLYDLTFCKDATLVDKKPLFGFEAAQKFQATGIQVSADKILLGEDVSGRPLFSESGGKVDTQNVIFHRVVAGSRSGKGVMTMNILASSVASGSAVFYLDRKPDMSGEISYLTNRDTFVVNGGSLTSIFDVHKQYCSSDSPGLAIYRQRLGEADRYYNYPYLTELFNSDGKTFYESYEGAFGDFIYLRAASLVINILMARIEAIKDGASADSQIYRDLRLDIPMMIILDETTNFHKQFENTYFYTDPTNSNIMQDKVGVTNAVWYNVYNKDFGVTSDKNIKDRTRDLERKLGAFTTSYEKHTKDLEALNAKIDSGDDDNGKALDERTRLLSKIDKDSEALEKTEDLLRAAKADQEHKKYWLYWGTLFDTFQDSLQELSSLNNAGKSAEMFMKHDVWMIGQTLIGLPAQPQKGLYTTYGNKKVMLSGDADVIARKLGVAESDATASWLLGFFDVFSSIGHPACDWFIGKQDDGKMFFFEEHPASKTSNTDCADVKRWCCDRSNWAYCAKGGSLEYMLRTVKKKDCVMFKPYLVLNTSDEKVGSYDEVYNSVNVVKEKEGHTYSYIMGVADRVKVENFKPIRKRILRKGADANVCGPEQLQPGIGLKGLIEEYRRTQDKGWVFTPDCMHASKEIADNVCRLFGYSDYEDYLFDFSPKSVINFKAIMAKYAGKSDEDVAKEQFKRYFNTGCQSLIGFGDSLENDDSSSSADVFGSQSGTDTVVENQQAMGTPSQDSQSYDDDDFGFGDLEDDVEENVQPAAETPNVTDAVDVTSVTENEPPARVSGFYNDTPTVSEDEPITNTKTKLSDDTLRKCAEAIVLPLAKMFSLTDNVFIGSVVKQVFVELRKRGY